MVRAELSFRAKVLGLLLGIVAESVWRQPKLLSLSLCRNAVGARRHFYLNVPIQSTAADLALREPERPTPKRLACFQTTKPQRRF